MACSGSRKICPYAPNCYRLNKLHWEECVHPNQDGPLQKPSCASWLAQQNSMSGAAFRGSDATSTVNSKHSSFDKPISGPTVPFTPRKNGEVLVPETPSPAAVVVEDSPVRRTRIPSKKRSQAIESSDDEAEQIDDPPKRPHRKMKRIVADESEGDDDNIADERASSDLQNSSGDSRAATVDLCSDDVVEVHSDTERDPAELIEESVDELLFKCEEVGEELRQQVMEKTVIEQPSCVGSKSLRLKKYQLVGLNWLNNLDIRQVNGILADEMGLGKTIQSIAFLGHLRETRPDGPHLIVSPASTLENWKRELNLWLPSADVVVYHGSQKEREAIRRRLRSDGVDVILTTYSYFQVESAKQDRSFLRQFTYHCMVLDEGHSVKNADAARYRRLMKISYKRCILLTGTPINNNLPELLVLLQFLMPDVFEGEGLEELQEACSRLDKRRGRGSNGGSGGGGGGGGASQQDGAKERLVERIKALMRPFVLRRRKADVLQELVPKVDHVHMLDLPLPQRKIYDGIVARWKKERAQAQQQNGGGVAAAGRRAIANVFTELRKAGNHPMLVRSRFTDAELPSLAAELHKRGHFGGQCTREMVLKELQGYSDYEISNACRGYRALAKHVIGPTEVAASAKFQKVGELIEEMRAGGHRGLIFSQWTGMLDLLGDYLESIGAEFLRLDGSTPVKERQDLIDQYNRDPSILVFLLSTRAGGLGINLTAADTVIMHDLDFNPQADRQAEDRCHRIGQTRPVHIHRLVVRGTVDADIFEIADRKRRLAGDMLDESDERGEGGGGGGGEDGDAVADGGEDVDVKDLSMQHIIESCLAKLVKWRNGRSSLIGLWADIFETNLR